MENRWSWVEERLRQLSFFHLGADADIKIEPDLEGLKCSVQHDRVSSFCFMLSIPQLEAMNQNLDRLEDLFLIHLTTHRKSG